MTVTFAVDSGTRYDDSESQLNVSNINAALLLRALGLLPELGAAAFAAAPGQYPDRAGPVLDGSCPAEDMLGRVELALALAPDDDGLPWHATGTSGRFVDCGREPGYLQDRLFVLRGIALTARVRDRPVVWG